jgi:HTH-type transcriptional regulator/antitoxin HipB
MPPLPSNGGIPRSVEVGDVEQLAAAVRARRTAVGTSQAKLASLAGVSRKWIYEFEAGKPAAELGLVLRVLGALGLSLSVAPGVPDAFPGADDAAPSPLAGHIERWVDSAPPQR